MKHKKIFIILSIILSVIIISGIFLGFYIKHQVKDLFHLNKELQEEGYYMGDFEFKMMGIVYWIDKGNYSKAFSMLNKYHHQLKSRENLIKIPHFETKEQELEFYLNLQNPKTGAFIDDAYPYPVYNEVTENAIGHIESLSKELNKSVKLKYPLNYLDEINKTEDLEIFLNDTAYVGWISTKFPQTTYVFARSILSYQNSEDTIGKNNLYNFSSEWKHALLKWFYENQDPETGFWGPRSRGEYHKLLKKDLTNTASIIKAFTHKNGSDIYKEFPLRYKDKMLNTTLEILSEPMPEDDEIEEWHEWNLKMGKGIAMLTRYLLENASEEDKYLSEKIIKEYIKIKFEKN
jgi:hypothetical protein